MAEMVAWIVRANGRHVGTVQEENAQNARAAAEFYFGVDEDFLVSGQPLPEQRIEPGDEIEILRA